MASTARRAPLDRASIVAAGVALADEEGVDALSMRHLATRLGSGVMSLYNHVASKDELLSLMVDAVAGEVAGPPPGAPPLDAVRRVAVSTRETFLAHPWAAGLWQRHLPGPSQVRGMEQLLGLFDESGLAPDLAHHGFHAVTNHVLGYTLQELGMSIGADDPDATARGFLADLEGGDHPRVVAHVRQHVEGHTASSFELVLDLILDGLVRLDQTGPAPPGEDE